MRRAGGHRSRRSAVWVVCAILVVLAIWVWRTQQFASFRQDVGSRKGSVDVCVWNVENLFDDRDDPALDDDVEDWMGQQPGIALEKCRRIARALRSLNSGRGPDLIGVMEVENRRALEMLRTALNDGLSGSDRYEWVVHRDDRTGRRIEPAWIGRLPMEEGTPSRRRRGGPRRIVHALVKDGEQPLHLLLSHWTSRRTQDSDDQRAGYARELRARVEEILDGDPGAAVLVAGDFNEELGTPVARELTGGAGLIDLLAGVDPTHRATLVYRGHGYAYDQMLGTRGAVAGPRWHVIADSAAVLDGKPFREPGRNDSRPWRFGGPDWVGERGYSDHFPIEVRLKPETTQAAASGVGLR